MFISLFNLDYIIPYFCADVKREFSAGKAGGKSWREKLAGKAGGKSF